MYTNILGNRIPRYKKAIFITSIRAFLLDARWCIDNPLRNNIPGLEKVLSTLKTPLQIILPLRNSNTNEVDFQYISTPKNNK